MVELLKSENTRAQEQRLVEQLKQASDTLDQVIRSISDTLQHGITAYEKQSTYGNQ
jgi:hypothetical protein